MQVYRYKALAADGSFVEGVMQAAHSEDVRAALLDVVLDGLVDAIQEGLVVERFFDEIDSPGLHGPNCGRNVAVASDKNDRHVCPISRNLFLQIEAVEDLSLPSFNIDF